MDDPGKIGAKYIAAVDPQEMAVRILEGFTGLERPHGSTAQQALDGTEPTTREAAIAAAIAALEYIRESFNDMNRTN